MDTLVVMGSIGAPYGVQGWVKINSFAEPKENLFHYSWQVERSGEWQMVEVQQYRAHAGGFVAKLVQIADRDQAALFTNCKIGVQREELPELTADQYYWADLVGMQVFTHANVILGTVVDILETGANDVLVIEGEKEHLVPLVIGDYVKEVDLDAKRMIVEWDPEF